MDDLSQAQSSLSRALGRARAGEDRELSGKVRERGEQLGQMLAGLLKMTRVHAADNKAFDVPLAEFRRALEELIDLLGTVHLVTVEDQVYVNDIRARGDGKAMGSDLAAALSRHNVGGLSFHGPLDDVQARALVAGFAGRPAPEAPRRALQEQLAARGLRAVELVGRFRFRLTDEGGQQRDPGATLERALQRVQEAWNSASTGRIINPLPLRRVVVEMLEMGPGAQGFWEAYPEAPAHAVHAVQVTLTALLVAQAMGLSQGALQDLGIAALLHDVGYAVPSPDASAQGRAPAPPPLSRHAGDSARLMLRHKGFHEAKIRRLRAVLEHHRDLAGSGSRPSLLGSVLRISEDYQTLVRIYGARVTRAAVLGAMQSAGGKLYEPTLVQLLVNTLGAHPPGTLLELADGRMARSVTPTRSAATFAKPVVRLLDPRTRSAGVELLDLGGAPPPRRALPG